MTPTEAQRYANAKLAHFIGKDFSLDSTQIQFCYEFRQILEYFQREDLTVVSSGWPVIGCTFDHNGLEDVPMIIHSRFWE